MLYIFNVRAFKIRHICTYDRSATNKLYKFLDVFCPMYINVIDRGDKHKAVGLENPQRKVWRKSLFIYFVVPSILSERRRRE